MVNKKIQILSQQMKMEIKMTLIKTPKIKMMTANKMKTVLTMKMMNQVNQMAHLKEMVPKDKLIILKTMKRHPKTTL
jgi:hypothetical protein